MIRATLRLAAMLIMVGDVGATNVYKCVGADGRTSFQDRPCGSGQSEQRILLPDAPASTDASTPDIDASTTHPQAAVAASPLPPPVAPPPSFFLCTRYDGSRYLSDDGAGGGSAVPYGMLAGSGQGLAQAYGGPNGIGVSAPGLHTPPSIPTAQVPLASAYVWVADECHRAAPQEACAYLRDRLDAVERKLKHAFSDTETQLKDERATLRTRMQGC